MSGLAKLLKTGQTAAPSASHTLVQSLTGQGAQKPPWQKSTHKMYAHLPPTLRTFAPTNNSIKHKVVLVKSACWKYRPVKYLAVGYPDAAGRNNSGRITIRGRGGGHKSRTLTINYMYSTPEIPKKLLAWEYGRRHSSWFSLVYYANGTFAYHPMVDGIEPGSMTFGHPKRGSSVIPMPGEWWKLADIPAGQMVCNIEFRPNGGGQIARAAGAHATILANKPETKAKGLVPLLLPSKEVRLLDGECWATIGRIGCPDHKYESHGKAGRRRWFGRRPKVRGIAQNPIDHPHGGGKGGKCSGKRGGRRPGPWSYKFKLRAHHMKTRNKSKPSWDFIARRKKDSKGLDNTQLVQWTMKAYTAKQRKAEQLAATLKAEKAEAAGLANKEKLERLREEYYEKQEKAKEVA